MDALSLAILLTACAPAVHPITASALVDVESGLNENAIGIVGAALVRQPRSRREAIATAVLLRSQGMNFSVGLAQINVRNLERLRLTLREAFEPCRNLRAMESILASCFDRSHHESPQSDLRRALSCYYSGNFTTGFRHGYVHRVVVSARQSSAASVRAPP
jgi:type IV secretion system protein VirB1